MLVCERKRHKTMRRQLYRRWRHRLLLCLLQEARNACVSSSSGPSSTKHLESSGASLLLSQLYMYWVIIMHVWAWECVCACVWGSFT